MIRNSNFLFLAEHWDFLLQDTQQVESYALRDPRAAAKANLLKLKANLPRLKSNWLFCKRLRKPTRKQLVAVNTQKHKRVS
jgi:type I restriction enzyme R subunit